LYAYKIEINYQIKTDKCLPPPPLLNFLSSSATDLDYPQHIFVAPSAICNERGQSRAAKEEGLQQFPYSLRVITRQLELLLVLASSGGGGSEANMGRTLRGGDGQRRDEGRAPSPPSMLLLPGRSSPSTCAPRIRRSAVKAHGGSLAVGSDGGCAEQERLG
jgi:hypothetical protein